MKLYCFPRDPGFLEHIQHGDLVLADRGFDIRDELALIGASLAVPPYMKGKSQLSQRCPGHFLM